MKFLPLNHNLHLNYLTDESCLRGNARYLCIPENIAELSEAIKYCFMNKWTYLVSGSRTGICGSASPLCDVVISTEKLTSIRFTNNSGNAFIIAECGAALSDIQHEAERHHHRFLPNPSETSATIGGLIACNAKGSNSFRFGSIGENISELTVILPDGHIQNLCRENDSSLFHDFIGMEGITGTISQCVLQLQKKQGQTWGCMFFFKENSQCLKCMEKFRPLINASILEAFEYYDTASLKLLHDHQDSIVALKSLPEISVISGGALYLELFCSETLQIEEQLMELLNVFILCGGKEEHTWVVTMDSETEHLRQLRHALPEYITNEQRQVNQQYPTCTKSCMDVSFPPGPKTQCLSLIQLLITQSNIAGYVFGHAYENRFHIDLIPRSQDEKPVADQILDEIAAKCVAKGGSILNENGVGKTRRALFRKYAPNKYQESLQTLKDKYDPLGLINPGNIL